MVTAEETLLDQASLKICLLLTKYSRKALKCLYYCSKPIVSVVTIMFLAIICVLLLCCLAYVWTGGDKVSTFIHADLHKGADEYLEMHGQYEECNLPIVPKLI